MTGNLVGIFANAASPEKLDTNRSILSVRGSDGKLYNFIVEATGSTISTGDERTIQLFQLLNR